jgi:hypothetical protein
MAQRTSSEVRKQNSGAPVIIAVVVIVLAIAAWFLKWYIIWGVLRMFGVNPPQWVKDNIEIRN